MLPRKRLLQTRAGALEHVLSGRGRPVWLLFSGAGVTLEGWRDLYPGIERLGTVLAWNRLGAGRSSRPRGPQTGSAVVASLRELLGYLDLAPPYILVGHSLGALHAELFARLYPQEVQAVALLEPAHPGQRGQWQGEQERLAGTLARLLGVPAGSLRANLQAEVDKAGETARQRQAAGPFPPVPLLVVSGGRDPPRWLGSPQAARQRRERQGALARLSPAGEHVVLPRSGHFPQRSEPQRVLALLRALAGAGEGVVGDQPLRPFQAM